jgi:hypothetical protein
MREGVLKHLVLILVVATAAIGVVGATSAAASNDPVRLAFDKSSRVFPAT